MKHIAGSTPLLTLAALGLLGAAVVDSATTRAAEWPAAQVTPAAENSLKAGIDAYREGALEISVAALSEAIGGKLSSKQMAEALYFRGLAYRELRLPGQAVMDLSSAISLKNGLSKSRLKDAVKNRDGAAREAGVSSAESVIAGEATAKGARTQVSVPAGRLPLPADHTPPPAPPETGSIPPTPVPPMPDDGFVSTIQNLIFPDWP